MACELSLNKVVIKKKEANALRVKVDQLRQKYNRFFLEVATHWRHTLKPVLACLAAAPNCSTSNSSTAFCHENTVSLWNLRFYVRAL